MSFDRDNFNERLDENNPIVIIKEDISIDVYYLPDSIIEETLIIDCDSEESDVCLNKDDIIEILEEMGYIALIPANPSVYIQYTEDDDES